MYLAGQYRQYFWINGEEGINDEKNFFKYLKGYNHEKILEIIYAFTGRTRIRNQTNIML